MQGASEERPRSRKKGVVESWQMSKWEVWREDAGRQPEKDDSDATDGQQGGNSSRIGNEWERRQKDLGGWEETENENSKEIRKGVRKELCERK